MSEPTLYEAVYIINTSVSEEETEQLIASLEAGVEESGGEVLGTRDFRTRRLAYAIDGQTHGTYKLLYFYGTGAVVDHMLAEMSIRQQILRSRIFVANLQAVIGGLEAGRGEEEAEAVEAAEAAEPTEATEAAAEEAVTEAPESSEAPEVAEVEETSEAEETEATEEAGEPAQSEEAPSGEEAPATEQ